MAARIRLTRIQHLVLQYVREESAISINRLAALVDADRDSVQVALYRLEQLELISRHRGRGATPNRYSFVGVELNHGLFQASTGQLV